MKVRELIGKLGSLKNQEADITFDSREMIVIEISGMDGNDVYTDYNVMLGCDEWL